LYIGIFCIECSLYPSYIKNTTFRNISDPSAYTDGGILYLNTKSYSNNFTIDRCIFSTCIGYYGGVIYLGSLSPSIKITRCRFEQNEGIYGNDIYASSSSCFSPNTIFDTCTTGIYTGIYCALEMSSITKIPCFEDIVLYFEEIFIFLKKPLFMLL
jgi:hypothetical protein